MKCVKLLIKTSSFVSVNSINSFCVPNAKRLKMNEGLLWKISLTSLSIPRLFDMFTHFLLPFLSFHLFFFFFFLLKMNKVDICCGICQGTGAVRNKRKTTKIASWGGKHIPFITSTKVPVIMIVLMLTIVVSVLGDDTQAFRDTLSSLCSLNKEGHFGSCCENYDISSVTLASSAARNCFIYSLSSTSGSITELFVLQMLY